MYSTVKRGLHYKLLGQKKIWIQFRKKKPAPQHWLKVSSKYYLTTACDNMMIIRLVPERLGSRPAWPGGESPSGAPG